MTIVMSVPVVFISMNIIAFILFLAQITKLRMRMRAGVRTPSFVSMVILSLAIMSNWRVITISMVMKDVSSASGAGAITITFDTIPFTVLRGWVLKAINRRVHGLATVWMIPIMMFTGTPQDVIPFAF